MGHSRTVPDIHSTLDCLKSGFPLSEAHAELLAAAHERLGTIERTLAAELESGCQAACLRDSWLLCAAHAGAAVDCCRKGRCHRSADFWGAADKRVSGIPVQPNLAAA